LASQTICGSKLIRSLDVWVISATPEWVNDRPMSAVRMRMLSMADANRSTRELMRSSILRRQGSRLNFKDASLFGGLLSVA